MVYYNSNKFVGNNENDGEVDGSIFSPANNIRLSMTNTNIDVNQPVVEVPEPDTNETVETGM